MDIVVVVVLVLVVVQDEYRSYAAFRLARILFTKFGDP